MSKGLGRVELLILQELRQGGAQDVNSLAIAVFGGKSAGVLYLSSSSSAYQAVARAVQSLIKKGLITRSADLTSSKRSDEVDGKKLLNT